jgi:uncharacterized integral membrane protein
MTDDDRNEADSDHFGEPVPPKSAMPEPVNARGELPWGLVMFLVLIALVVVFAVQNTADVPLEFLGWNGSYPLAVVIIAVILVTVVLDEILGVFLRRRRRRRIAEKEELRRLREGR